MSLTRRTSLLGCLETDFTCRIEIFEISHVKFGKLLRVEIGFFDFYT